MRPGSNPPSPYLDVSTAASAFNSSQPRSPPSQQRRCCSPSLGQQFPTSPSSYSTSCLRSSWEARDRLISDAGGSAADATAAAAVGSSSLQGWWLGSPSCPAVAASTASSNPTSAAHRQPQGPVVRSQQLQRQQQPSAGQPTNNSSSSSSNYAAAMSRARRCKPVWDDNTNPPSESSFEEAVSAWQQAMEAGAYGR